MGAVADVSFTPKQALCSPPPDRGGPQPISASPSKVLWGNGWGRAWEGGPGPHGYALQGHSPRLLCDQGHPCREVRGTGNIGASLPLLKGALDPYWGQHRSLDPPPAPQQHHQDGVRVGPLQAAPGGGTAQHQQRCPKASPLQNPSKSKGSPWVVLV